ncbi:hypothetical protein HanIR_Chr01g0043491 [Helianthus annuus]|nr:hypothetical protein HanIR_Chr01g0043491 [Helianthus annuus]
MMRISSSGSGWSAMVRQRQRQAVSTSKVEQFLRYGGTNLRNADTSAGPKKNDLCAMSSSGIMVPLVSSTLSYS